MWPGPPWSGARAGLLAIAIAAFPQQPPTRQVPEQPAFRSGVDLVEVDVVAVDAANRPVADLRQDEFQVYDDGRLRELISFTHVSLPIPEAHQPALVDVSSNAQSEEGRLFFLILDDANSSRSSTEPVRAAARDLVSRLAPPDRVGMLWVSLRKKGAHEFTTNHAAILHAITAFEGEIRSIESRSPSPSISPLDTRTPVGDANAQTPVGDSSVPTSSGPPDLKRFFDTLRPFKMVHDVSRYVASLPNRRKAVVYIGEALRPLGPVALRSSDRDLELQRTVTEARRANVSVYLLDPRSPLRRGAEDLFEENDENIVERLRFADFSALASATGGFTATSAVLRTQIDRIILDTSSYYLLGYYADPPEPRRLLGRIKPLANRWDGFRRIEVRTTRPGVRLRARKGYWPEHRRQTSTSRSPVNVSDQVFATTRGLIPKSELSLRAFAAAFRGDERKHSVALAVEAHDEAFAADPKKGFKDAISLAVVAYEPGEKVRQTHFVTATAAIPEGNARTTTDRYLFCTSLELPPGQYQLRVGMHSAMSGKMGSVYHDLAVPNFDTKPLTMSDIVIGQTAGAAPMPVARAQTIAKFAPFVPSLTRDFDQDDAAYAFVRVYRTREARTAEFTVTATIARLGDDTAVWESSAPASFLRTHEAQFRIALPLPELQDGRYRLTIETQDAGGRFSAQRQLDFRIRSVNKG